MAMVSIPYKCRFCGTQHVTEYDDSAKIDKDKWLNKLCCNTCYDFYTRRIWLSGQIATVCSSLVTFTASMREIPYELLTACKDKLAKLTKAYARLYCDHHRLRNEWDNEVVDELCSNPTKPYKVLKTFETTLKSKSNPTKERPLPYVD